MKWNRDTIKKGGFIGAFLLSLTGPTLLYPAVRDHLDQTNYENRELASFPELSVENFDHIPAEFEAYYNDHVPFKNLFVKAKTKLDLKLLGDSSISDITVGKDNWLFYTVSEEGEDALADYQKTNLYSAEEKEQIRSQIESVRNELEAKGIRFFLFEAPNKETIYGTYMPESVKTYGDQSRLDVIIPELRDEYGLPVYDLKDSLAACAEDCQLFYRYDTHWNRVGAFVGSQQMAEILTGSSVPLSEVRVAPAGTCSGDMARMLNLAAEYSDDVEYTIEGYLPDITVTRTEEDENGTFAVFESNSSNDKTLLLVGDSFSHGLKFFLPKLYRRAVFATFDTYDSSMIERYQPDDFVYLTVERNQELFENPETIIWYGQDALKTEE